MTTTNTQTYTITKRYPFLINFPFPEFKIELGEPTSMNIEDAAIDQSKPDLVKFIYERNDSSMTILIFEQELTFINKVAEKISALDTMAKIINNALDSNDLLIKRDAVLFAENWCTQLHDNRSRLSYSAAGEILINLVDSHSELVRIINKITKLHLVQGVVGLSTKEYSVVLTYLQFQLIYAKMLLGIVISSKISL